MSTTAPILGRKSLLGATVETTAGTPASVIAALAGTVFYNAQMVPNDWYPESRKPIGLGVGTSPRLRGGALGTLTVRQELRHGDGLLTLLSGCGFEVSGSVATPRRNLALHSCLTFALWEDGRKKILSGAMGSGVIAPAGPQVFIDWTFQGIMDEVTDVAMPALPTVTGEPFVSRGKTLTVGGSSIPPISTFSLDLGNEVVPRTDLTAAEGVLHFMIVDWDRQLTLDPEARLVATHDAYGLLRAGTTQAVSLALATPGGDSLTFAAAAAQRINVTNEDRNKKRTDSLELELHDSAGDDSLTVTSAASV